LGTDMYAMFTVMDPALAVDGDDST
jgi:hypothetical protein